MSELANDPAFQTYAICVAILSLKMLGSAVYTGTQRQRSAGYINPEDARAFGGGTAAAASEHPTVARALRIQRNDTENIPIFFALGLVYVILEATPTGAAIYCWSYTLARIGHTFAYALELQPWRALLFGVGLLVEVGMAAQIIF